MTTVKAPVKLTPEEYLKTVEEEWWIANLRCKIFERIDITAHSNMLRLLSYKQGIISRIGERMGKPTIFTDEERMKCLCAQFENNGMPLFKGLSKADVEAYYSKGALVLICNNDRIISTGVVMQLDYHRSTVEIRRFGQVQIEKVLITRVRRLFVHKKIF